MVNKNIIKLVVATILISAIVPLIYVIFTDFVHYFQELIWFDIANTDENKTAIIPLSIIGGLAMSLALVINKKILGREMHHDIKDIFKDKQITLNLIIATFIIGAVSLIGGASLGPEAILLPISFGVGYLLAKGLGIDNPQIIGLIAIISILASFFNGFFAAFLPMALIFVKMGKDKKATATIIVLGAMAALISVYLLRFSGIKEGYVKLPTIFIESVTPTMLIVAIAVGLVATYMTTILSKLVELLKAIFNKMPKNWIAQGLIAGLGVGIIYYLLGPVSFFSGHTALESLIYDNSEYTSLQLAGLAAGKLLVTAWCVATIYRGGVIYPLLVVAMSLSLLFVGAYPDSTWLATLLVATFVGAFSGRFNSVIIAAAFVLPLFGTGAITIVLAAVVGSAIALKISTKFSKKQLAIQ